MKVSAVFAAAAAIITRDTECVCNVLRDQKHTRQMPHKLIPLALQWMGAAALLLFAIGVHLNARIRTLEVQSEQCNALEKKAWASAIPQTPFQADQLAQHLNKAVLQQTKSKDASTYRSALDVWSDIAQTMPAPDKVGFAMESLQIGPDGARMNGRVTQGKTEPLEFATALEASLNSSPTLNARGEFETSKDGDVAVRMRLDPKAKPKGAN